MLCVSSASETSAEQAKKAESGQPTVHMTSEVPHHGRHQRPSLIEFLTGGELSGRHSSKSASDQHGHQQHKGVYFVSVLFMA